MVDRGPSPACLVAECRCSLKERGWHWQVRDVRIEYRLDTLPSNQALDTLSSNQAAPAGQALDIRTVATILSAHRCLNATAGSY